MNDIENNNDINNLLSESDMNPCSGVCEESQILPNDEQELGAAIFSPYIVDHTNPYMVDKFIDSTNRFSPDFIDSTNRFSPDYIDSTNRFSTQHIDTSNPFSPEYIPDDI